jgi:hypothetical protein
MFRTTRPPKNETPEQRMARLDREAGFAYRARNYNTSATQRLNNYKEDMPAALPHKAVMPGSA